MFDYVRRLAATGAAYTASSVISKLFAVALLPVYTRHLTRADYGAAEVLLSTVVVLSIFFRLGIIEALLRFYYRFDDRVDRVNVARTSVGFLLLSTTAGALLVAAFAGPLSELLLGHRDTELMLIAVGGLWIFTNYELMMALFRLDERARDYFTASIVNVLLTIALTVWLVVGRDEGAKGLLLGNFGASAIVLAGLFYVHRHLVALVPSGGFLRPMLRFGLPTMPAEISLYALNFIDRIVLVRYVGLAEAGLYSLAVKFSQVVTVVVRAFNLAWPPLAYSIRDDDEARRAYSRDRDLLPAGRLHGRAGAVARGALGRAGARRSGVLRLLQGDPAGLDRRRALCALPGAVGRGRAGGRTEFNFPVTAAAAGVNLLPQPAPGAAVRARRRRARAGRLLRRDARPDVCGDPAGLPVAVRMGAHRCASSGWPGRSSPSVSSCCRRRAPLASSRARRWCRLFGAAALRERASCTRASCAASARCSWSGCARRRRSAQPRRRRTWKPCAAARI